MIASMTAIDRALLNAEWPCSSCPGAGVHQADCPMDESLSERGYPDQASRNAARDRLRAANSDTLAPGPPSAEVVVEESKR